MPKYEEMYLCLDDTKRGLVGFGVDILTLAIAFKRYEISKTEKTDIIDDILGEAFWETHDSGLKMIAGVMEAPIHDYDKVKTKIDEIEKADDRDTVLATWKEIYDNKDKMISEGKTAEDWALFASENMINIGLSIIFPVLGIAVSAGKSFIKLVDKLNPHLTILPMDTNDFMFGCESNDTFKGGEGSDYINGAGGDDNLFGEVSIDSSEYKESKAEQTLVETESFDIIVGGSGNDFIFGGVGNDDLYGDELLDKSVSGNDIVIGGSGDDKIYGQNGRDTLIGGSGEDLLMGGNDKDFLDGGSGNDVILGYEISNGTLLRYANDERADNVKADSIGDGSA